MVNRRAVSNLGVYLYGAGAIALGISGLVWRDFATNWQRVEAGVPHREALAILTSIYEIAAGAAIVWPRTRRIGAAMLTGLYAIFVLLWVSPALRSPRIYDNWGNFFEEFSLVVGGMTVYSMAAPQDSVWARQRTWIIRLYAICPISFAIDHFVYLSGAASFVPKWIPPGQKFWVVTTAVCFLLAAAAILSGILAGLAAQLLAVMMMCFEVLVWLPMFFKSPHAHVVWGGNMITIAMAGAAWVVADAIRESEQLVNPIEVLRGRIVKLGEGCPPSCR